MFTSWKLGSAFGIGIFVHWTFLLIPAYLLFMGGGSGGAEMIVFLMAFVAAVFGCVVLHELGHALMARRFGIGTRDITLYPIGGVARLERMSERPWEEFWIALAGPAVNVVIAAVLALWLYLPAGDLHYASLVDEFAEYLLGANLMLVGFNLLPAFPMDGGRVLRALLSHWLGRLRATEIATHIAGVIAAIMFIVGAIYWHIFLMFGAVFVFLVGRAELAAVRWKDRAGRHDPREAYQVDVAGWSTQPTPATPGFTGFAWDERSRTWILWQNGRPVQAVSPE